MEIKQATMQRLAAFARNGRFIPSESLISYKGGLLLIPDDAGYVSWFADWPQLVEYFGKW